jgi:integrase
MPRPATGQVVERKTRRGVVFALRFRAYGQRQYVTLGTAADGWTLKRAEVELANVLADVRRGIWQPPAVDQAGGPEAPAAVPTFHEFSSEWYARRELDRLRPKTLEQFRWALELHLLPVFAREPLDRITIAHVDRYVRGKLADGKLSPRSVNHTVSVLAAILEVAVEYDHLPRNPAAGRRRRAPVPKTPRNYLDTAEHLTALLDGAGRVDAASRERRGQRRALIATLAFAGLRIGEALELRWRDVNLADGRLHVRGSKTAAADRVVTVLPILRDELLAYRATLADVDRAARVFGSSTGGRQSESNVRQRILIPAVRHAAEALAHAGTDGLPPRLTPHSLRRTFASLLAALGEPMPSTIRQLGHTDPALTLRVYQHDGDRGQAERDRLRALVEGREWAPMGTSARSASAA